MSGKGKRNAVAVVMALLVCAAAAVNWRYSGRNAADALRTDTNANEDRRDGSVSDAANEDVGSMDIDINAVAPSPLFGLDDGNGGSQSITPSDETDREYPNPPEYPNAETKILGEATLVSSRNQEQDDINLNEHDVYSGADYFASARLSRQQARDNAVSLLQEAAEQDSADQTLANEASAGIQTLAGYALKEARIESLVAAKGYADCVAFMGEDAISVVVSTGSGELSAEDVAKITDIAVTETGYPASGVKIMAAD